MRPHRRRILSATVLAAACSTLGLSATHGQDTPAAMGMEAPAPAASFNPTRPIKMRPPQKRALLLKESERNPYARRNPHEEVAAQETINAEEIRIRNHIASMRVAGRSTGPNGMRVLLGDLILEEGRILPQLIEGQSEGLRVIDVNEDTVVLGWIDAENGNPTGKSMQIGYDLSPVVSFALGAPETSRDGNSDPPRMGRIHIDRERKKETQTIARAGSEMPSTTDDAPENP